MFPKDWQQAKYLDTSGFDVALQQVSSGAQSAQLVLILINVSN